MNPQINSFRDIAKRMVRAATDYGRRYMHIKKNKNVRRMDLYRK